MNGLKNTIEAMPSGGGIQINHSKMRMNLISGNLHKCGKQISWCDILVLHLYSLAIKHNLTSAADTAAESNIWLYSSKI